MPCWAWQGRTGCCREKCLTEIETNYNLTTNWKKITLQKSTRNIKQQTHVSSTVSGRCFIETRAHAEERDRCSFSLQWKALRGPQPKLSLQNEQNWTGWWKNSELNCWWIVCQRLSSESSGQRNNALNSLLKQWVLTAIYSIFPGGHVTNFQCKHGPI